MLVLEVTVQNKLKFPPPPSPSPWSISNSKVGGLFPFLHIFLKQGCETIYNQVYNGCLFFRNFSWTFDLHPPYIELSFRGSRKRILINNFLWKFANLFWQSPDTCMIHGQWRVSGYWAGRGHTTYRAFTGNKIRSRDKTLVGNKEMWNKKLFSSD